jgi:hypothetical protein
MVILKCGMSDECGDHQVWLYVKTVPAENLSSLSMLRKWSSTLLGEDDKSNVFMSGYCGKSSSSLVREEGSNSESVISLALLRKRSFTVLALFFCGGEGTGAGKCSSVFRSFF